MEAEPQVIDAQVEPKEETKQQISAKPKAIALHEDMSLAPSDHLEFKAVIAAIDAGGGFPSRFKTIQQKIAAANLATSLMGKKWQLALNNIADIKGTLAIYGELPGAIAEQTNQVAQKRVFCIDEDYQEICTKNKNLNKKPFAGVCIIQRKDRPANEFTYTLDEAREAGQYPATKAEYVDNKRTGRMIENADSPWMKFTKVMLMRKAMNMAIKFEFPDAIVACPVAEYDYGIAPDLDPTMKDVTPRSNVAEEMNKEFGGKNDGEVHRMPATGSDG